MATEGTPNSQAPGAGAAPPPSAPSLQGALALVAASAIGSFLGSRMSVKPLAVAVGATVLAWLNRKKVPASPALPPGAAPPPQPTTPALFAPEPMPAPVTVIAPAPVAVPAFATPAPLPSPAPAPEPVVTEPHPVDPVFAPAPPAPFSFLPPPPNPAMDPRIQAWLAKQMDREERAAAKENIILDEPEFSPSANEPEKFAQPAPAPFPFAAEVPALFSLPSAELMQEDNEKALRGEEDDYRPEPLVEDPPAEHAAWEPHSFAELTEPLPVPPPVVEAERLPSPEVALAPVITPTAVAHASPPQAWPFETPAEESSRPVFSTSLKPLSQPLPAHRPPTAPLAAPFITASAIPGIEPLPSWNELSERRPQPLAASPASPLSVAPAPAPDLSTSPSTVGGVDLESLFDTPAFHGRGLPDEIQMAEPAAAVSDTPTIPATIPLFTAGPKTLSTPPTFLQESKPSADVVAAPTASSAPEPSPWHAPANTPIFAEAPAVFTAPSPWAPPTTAATSSTDPPPPSAKPASPLDEDPMASFFRAPEPSPVPAPEPVKADTPSDVPEIAVHVAAAGEAWFDSPLAGTDLPNPWLPPKGNVEGADVPLTSSFAPLTPSTSGPVVDAEVVLRPRAPTQASIVAKNPPTKPAFIDPDAPAAEDPAQPGLPTQSPREQRARANWRSWWKGD